MSHLDFHLLKEKTKQNPTPPHPPKNQNNPQQPSHFIT